MGFKTPGPVSSWCVFFPVVSHSRCGKECGEGTRPRPAKQYVQQFGSTSHLRTNVCEKPAAYADECHRAASSQCPNGHGLANRRKETLLMQGMAHTLALMLCLGAARNQMPTKLRTKAGAIATNAVDRRARRRKQ